MAKAAGTAAAGTAAEGTAAAPEAGGAVEPRRLQACGGLSIGAYRRRIRDIRPCIPVYRRKVRVYRLLIQVY